MSLSLRPDVQIFILDTTWPLRLHVGDGATGPPFAELYGWNLIEVRSPWNSTAFFIGWVGGHPVITGCPTSYDDAEGTVAFPDGEVYALGYPAEVTEIHPILDNRMRSRLRKLGCLAD